MTPLAELMFAGDYLDECLRLIHPTCNDDLCDICTALARWQDAAVSALVGSGDALAAKLADECTCGQCKSCTTVALWDKAREGHRR